jgi:hypothetical protein
MQMTAGTFRLWGEADDFGGALDPQWDGFLGTLVVEADDYA